MKTIEKKELTLVVKKPVTTCGDKNPVKGNGVQVPNWNINPTAQDRADKFRRREAVTVENETAGIKVVKYVSGGGAKNLKAGEMAISYDTKAELCLDEGDEIIIRRATKMEVWKYYYNHPDVGERLSMRLAFGGVIFGVVGAVLGVTGVALAIVSMM